MPRRSMLAGVARQNDAGLIFLFNSQERVHLFAANLRPASSTNSMNCWANNDGKQGAIASLTTQPMSLARIDPKRHYRPLGILMTGKAVQKFGQKPDGSTSSVGASGAGALPAAAAASPANPIPPTGGKPNV